MTNAIVVRDVERLRKLAGRGWVLRAIRIQHAESLMYCGNVDGKTWARRMGVDVGLALPLGFEVVPTGSAAAYADVDQALHVAGAVELFARLLEMPHVRGHLQLTIEVGRPCRHHRRLEYAARALRCQRWESATFASDWTETQHPIEDPRARAEGIERLRMLPGPR